VAIRFSDVRIGLLQSSPVEVDEHLFTSSNQYRRLSSDRYDSVINRTPAM